MLQSLKLRLLSEEMIGKETIALKGEIAKIQKNVDGTFRSRLIVLACSMAARSEEHKFDADEIRKEMRTNLADDDSVKKSSGFVMINKAVRAAKLIYDGAHGCQLGWMNPNTGVAVPANDEKPQAGAGMYLCPVVPSFVRSGGHATVNEQGEVEMVKPGHIKYRPKGAKANDWQTVPVDDMQLRELTGDATNALYNEMYGGNPRDQYGKSTKGADDKKSKSELVTSVEKGVENMTGDERTKVLVAAMKVLEDKDYVANNKTNETFLNTLATIMERSTAIYEQLTDDGGMKDERPTGTDG